jgi:capsule polysaccharide export protein KpsE/RkpR
LDENKSNQSTDNTSSLTLLDIIVIILKYKKKIILITSIFLVVSIILYFFVFDLIYTSTASIKSSSKSAGLLGALETGLPDIGDIGDLGVGGSKSSRELAAYEEILMSRRCLEVVINKFGLMERDDYRFFEDAIKSFREEQLKIKIDKLSGVMYISVLDKDPVLAKEMVETLLAELDKINIELNVTNAKNNREFIESRYLQSKEDLTKAEDSLKAYQLIYGIAPDLQIKASAQAAFTLEAELKAEEVKLDVLKKILSADQPEVKVQTEKVNSLRNKISEIQNSTDLSDFLRLGNSPQIAMNYLRLQRDVEIQTKIVAFLLPLYEQAKIEEKRETPTILVLDKPYVAERKTKPKRLTMVIVWTFIGFVTSIVISFLYDHYNKQKEGNTIQYQKLTNLFKSKKN